MTYYQYKAKDFEFRLAYFSQCESRNQRDYAKSFFSRFKFLRVILKNSEHEIEYNFRLLT